MIKKIHITQALEARNALLVDVRSPAEFEEDHLPGAFNVPLLNNQERHEVGIVYKQVGPYKARKLGLKMAAPKIEGFLNTILEQKKEKDLIFYCWRGGLRSYSMATFFDLLDLPVSIIDGGYKSYRNFVLEKINNPYPFELIVLYGMTGSGKTEVLQHLKNMEVPVIDLEKLACHRGSAFGHIGISEKRNQKQFDNLLSQEILKYKNEKHVFVEGESRKIGSLLLPEYWMRCAKSARKILVSAPLSARIERIVRTYSQVEALEMTFLLSIEKIRKRLGGAFFQELKTLLDQKNFRDFIGKILENYYDKTYFPKNFKFEKWDLEVTNHDSLSLAQILKNKFYE